MEAQNELVTVQAKLRDWTSLIPSCLVVQKDERVRSHVTSYNCTYMPCMIPCRFGADTRRSPSSLILCSSSLAVSCPDAPSNKTGQDNS